MDELEPVLWWLAADDIDGLLAQLDEPVPVGTDGPAPARGAATGPARLDIDDIDDPTRMPDAEVGSARLGIVDPDDRKVRLARRMLEVGEPWRGRSDIWFTPTGLVGPGRDGSVGRVAFLFPGVEPTFTAGTLDLPELGERLGLPVPSVADDTIAHRSASIYRLGIFLDLALRQLGVEPDMIAGHSLGEWSGTVASGMIRRDQASGLLGGVDLDAVELPEVDFAALSAGADAVDAVVAGMEGVLISHDNSPRQSVICAPPGIIDDALGRLREAGILGYKLAFRSGFHTPYIASALGAFRAHLDNLTFHPAKTPMWSATTVGPYPDTGDEIAELHLRHLVDTVRFRPLVERLYHEAGARVFVQVGSGSITSFVDDTLRDHDHLSVPVLKAKRSAVAQVQRALTALWVEGLAVRPLPPPAMALGSGTHVQPGGRPLPVSISAKSPPQAAALAPDAVPPAAATVSAAPAPDARLTTLVNTAAPAARAPIRDPAVAGDLAAVPYALAAAAEMLVAAARAGQDVVEALGRRLALEPVASGAAPMPARTVDLRHHVPPSVPDRRPGSLPSAVPSRPGQQPASPAPTPVGPDRTAWPREKTVVRRRLSLETMPETLDHTLFRQPEGWPDDSDRFPIVAMTTQIQLLQDIASEYAGGRDLIEVFGVRNLRWLDLSSPQDIDITIVPKGDDVLSLALGSYCRANVRFGRFRPGPRHDPSPLANPLPTRHTAREMFDLRVMFHGPRFQGISALGPAGDDGILGEFDNLDTPGSLLDNVGKLVAYWVINRRGLGESPLPIGVERIELFGPLPPVGVDLHCDVRIVELQDSLVRADGVVVLPDGSLWCRVEGWASHVFHLDQVTEPIYRDTNRHYAAEPQPGDWSVVIERWPTGAGRDLTARRFLKRAEREAYEQLNLLEQRRWLIDVVAAKDSVRRWLAENFGILSYPVEIEVVPDGGHRFRVVSDLVPEGHDPRVTVSSLRWLAVAIVGDGDCRDIEAREVTDGGDPDTVAAAAAAAVQARNPGADVTAVARVDHIAPSIIEVVVVPPFAVAWTP